MARKSVEVGLCSECSQHKLSPLAEELQETVAMKNGNWVDGYSKGKSDIWKKALEDATKVLEKPCLRILYDCESRIFCKDCMQKMVDMF